MTIHRLIALSLAVLLTGCSFLDKVTDADSSTTYSRRSYLAGRAAAQRDIQHGVLATESAGLPAEWSDEYVKLLKSRYGVEDRTVAGCMVDDRILGHMRGYNEVADTEIKRRFGADVFDRTAKDAQALYKKKFPHGRH